jgi:hypothetical protein
MPVWRAFRGAAGPGGRAEPLQRRCSQCRSSGAGPSAAAPGVHSQVVPRPTRVEDDPPATGAGRTEANRPDQVVVFHHSERTVLTPLRISDSDPEYLTTLAPSIHCWDARPLGTSAVFATAPWLLRLTSRTVTARPRYGAISADMDGNLVAPTTDSRRAELAVSRPVTGSAHAQPTPGSADEYVSPRGKSC